MGSLHRVFATTELLALILSFLGELSLARATGVSSLFRNVILGTKSLRSRIGLIDNKTHVLDTSRHSEHDYRENENLHWNPLLDWFTERIISSRASETPQGPLSNSREFVVFHILPHALRAFKNRDSTVHRMWITTPPVSTVRMYFTLKNAHRWPERWMSTGVEVHRPAGVTLGDLLELWADREPGLERHLSLAVGLHMMPPFTTEAAEEEVELRVGQAMNREWNTIHGQTASAESKAAAPEFVVPGLPKGLVFEWVKRTWGHPENEFYAMSMSEQGEAMRGVLVKQLEATRGRWEELLREDEWALWPALGLPEAREGGMEKPPYKVEYAAGLVFNRQN